MRNVYTGTDGLELLKRKEARLIISATTFNSTPAREFLEELQLVFELYEIIKERYIFCVPMRVIQKMQANPDYSMKAEFDGVYVKIYVVYFKASSFPAWYICTASIGKK